MTTRIHFRRVALLASLFLGTFSLLAVWADDVAASQPWIAPAREARKVNPVPTSDFAVAAGQTLYTKHCFSCHGTTGVGNGPAAKALERNPGNLSSPKLWEQSDGAIFWKLSTGKKPMPTFDTLTTETERWQIIDYVRTLAPKPAATSPSTVPAK